MSNTFLRVFLSAATASAFVASASIASSGAAMAAQPFSGRELLYVAKANSPVAAYDPRSNGYAVPVLEIPDPQLQNTVWDPWGVTFDSLGYLYVQSFASEATTFVYPPGANKNSKPARVFMGNGPDTRGVAVDPAGFEYILSSQQSFIFVLVPKAHGQPGNSYFVPPIRYFATDEALWFPWPDVLTTDAKDEVIAAIVRTGANAIEVFEGGLSGSSNPIRRIAGSNTGLGKCGQTCDNMSITYAPYDGNLYVAVSEGPYSHISVFADNANGNVPALRNIQGPKTGLSGQSITGIAVSARNGQIYAMVKQNQFGAGWVFVYPAGANGNVAPLRAFKDPDSFVDAQGIAITR
jgi:hypothetical protein